jgi:hypothetical protein|tara:strand:- start:322 stop:531 length:210 start_codon:yes stop_codon:yes gene_type:complete
MEDRRLENILSMIRSLREDVSAVPTNNASSGAIAGLPPDQPPVRKKKRKETPVGRYGSRKMWLQDLRGK